MSRIIVEDCLRISIMELNEVIGNIAKQQAYDWNIPPERRNEKWGLAQFFSQEKPEWQDLDDWAEDTKFEESLFLMYSKRYGGGYAGTLRIQATPLKKDQLIFTHTKKDGAKTSYVVRLTTIRRKYGSVQYYFMCPLCGGNGGTCNKRVSILYKPFKLNHFGCRHCYNLSYASCNITRTGRESMVFKTISDYERESDELLQRYISKLGWGSCIAARGKTKP